MYVLVRARARLLRLRCWWFGHADILQIRDGVINLRCGLCERETAGWRPREL